MYDGNLNFAASSELIAAFLRECIELVLLTSGYLTYVGTDAATLMFEGRFFFLI